MASPRSTLGVAPAPPDANLGVSLRFVLAQGKNESTCSDEMSEAFEVALKNDLAPLWIREIEALALPLPGKTDVFVMDPFSGPAFEKLQSGKCAVIGPRCLLSSLSEGQSVPDLPYPVYTTAMRDLVITSTGFVKDDKAQLQRSVERMGGIYANSFHEGVTHLVADVVRSRKYEVAVEKDIPIMSSEWVQVVWDKSKHGTLHATDKQFAKYACPALKGLCITVSQMYKKDKDLLRKCIESHGGIYSPVLDMEKTVILVIPKAEGEKFDYARKWKIPCVKPEWVYDSISKGYCLPTLDYRVEERKVSTPTRSDRSMASKLDEVSMCSTILGPPELNDETVTKHVDETVGNNTTMKSPGANRGDVSTNTRKATIASLFNQLDLQRVKKAGSFLEGCRVFTSGFTESQETHLSRVLQQAEAIKHNQLTDSVTHMIIGKRDPEHWQLLQRHGIQPYKMTLPWVVESMLMGHPVPEEDFLYNDKRTSDTQVLPNPEEQLTQFENDLMSQYQGMGSTKPTKEDPKDETIQFKVNNDVSRVDGPAEESSSSTQVDRFLQDKKLALSGFDETTEADLSDWVSEAGGELVFSDFKGRLDFLVVPPNGANSDFKALETVTSLWLEECLDAGQLIPLDYWHRPMKPLPLDPLPCEGVVMGVTIYSGRERIFITKLAEQVGMVAQEIFAKRDKDGAKKSTHLICSNPEGAKYEAALKWKLPVVTKDWLLACYYQREWVSERTFLIGKSNAVTPDRSEVTLEVLEQVKNGPKESKETNIEQKDETLDDTISFKTPVQSKMQKSKKMILNLETPGEHLDLEKLRPKPMNFTPSPSVGNEGGPSRWTADSQPSPSQGTLKRKRDLETDNNLPFFLDAVKTPKTPYGAFVNSNPSTQVKKFWKRQCDELGRYEMSELEKENLREDREKIRERYEEVDKEQSGSNDVPVYNAEMAKEDQQKSRAYLQKKGIPTIGQDGKSFEELMEEKMAKSGRSWKNMPKRRKVDEGSPERPDKAKVCLSGVVIFVAKKHREIQADIHSIVSSLGGGVCHSYDSALVTHVIFSGRVNDLCKEYRVAKKDGKFVVSPDWAYMCRDEKRRIEEDTFPHSFNPKKTLNITISSSQSVKRAPKKSRVNEDLADETDCTLTKGPDDTPNVADDISSHLAKIAEIVDASNGKDNSRRSMRISLTTGRQSPHSESIAHETTLTRRNLAGEFVVGGGPDSQAVQWHDPNEEDERAKLKARMELDTQVLKVNLEKEEEEAGQDLTSNDNKSSRKSNTNQPTFGSMEMPDNLTELMGDEQNESTMLLPDRVPKRFMMSCLSEKDRARFVTFLEKHEVGHSNAPNCDADATHIVAPKLTRSEKMLCSIASGKWILHHSYIDACIQADEVLDEGPYEWGNPGNAYLKDMNNDLEKKVAMAGYRWRMRLAREKRQGAYSGIKAILHTSKPRSEAFKRLLLMGDAQVLDVLPPYSDPQGATHCFAEMPRMKGVSVDFPALAKHGVAMVGPLFINEFLTSETPPNVEDYLVEEFQVHWNKSKH